MGVQKDMLGINANHKLNEKFYWSSCKYFLSLVISHTKARTSSNLKSK